MSSIPIPDDLTGFLTVLDGYATPSDFNDPLTFGCAHLPRGLMVYLNRFGPYHHTALVELDPQKGFRGRHGHLKKTEYFYVITGTSHGHYWRAPHGASSAHVMHHTPGQLIIIQPHLFHTFYPETHGWVLELATTPFDRHDTIPYDGP